VAVLGGQVRISLGPGGFKTSFMRPDTLCPSGYMSYSKNLRIYIRHIKPRKNDTYSREQAKVIMFFAFYAKNRGSGAFSEYLASDLNPIYSKNRLLFLELMGELPFLIPLVCDRLNAFFGFEGNNISGKESFVRDNAIEFEKYLSKEQTEICLAQFRK